MDYPLHSDKETLSRQLLSALRNIRIEPPALLVTKLQQMLQWILRVSIAHYISIMSWQPLVNTAWYPAAIRLSMRNYSILISHDELAIPKHEKWIFRQKPEINWLNSYFVGAHGFNNLKCGFKARVTRIKQTPNMTIFYVLYFFHILYKIFPRCLNK